LREVAKKIGHKGKKNNNFSKQTQRKIGEEKRKRSGEEPEKGKERFSIRLLETLRLEVT